jgi:recombination protein RecT
MGTKKENNSAGGNEVATIQRSRSERFTNMVIKEYGQVDTGHVGLTPYQKRLAQHLFVKIDFQLQELEKKRNDPKKEPIIWDNVNLPKLAIDAVHRIELGLDALIPNHVHPIPYWNTKMGKYDVNLQIGYAGKDLYYRELALNQPMDIIYELVHENDSLTVFKKGVDNEVESYDFQIKSPFDRGKVVGGFGYIMYENPQLNKLVLLSLADFDKAKSAAKSKEFWTNFPREMQLKTVVHRTVKKITLDPEKVNESFAMVEAAEYDNQIEYHLDPQAEIAHQANKGDVIDMGISQNASEAENGTNSEKAEQVDQGKDDSGKGNGDDKPRPAF